ncbi:type II secretion system F family protein [Zavarzinella formosa]|uniref:type II secretion system F family protein n=1 Tax=Zavarzinella formosa TaxID=360055 RepID=UPI0002DAD318|nr:type II secretion system F family protein [Zavarzinella formosa]
MPDFTYEAMGRLGDRSAGVLTATSEREASMMLDARGLFPIRIAPMRAKSAGSGGKKVKGRVVSAFYAQLADLLQSGVPLLKALDILEKQGGNPNLAFAIREVRAKVADGTTLADAMKPFPKVFNELSVSMVRAGQEGGFLEDVLRRIADFTEHSEDMKSEVIGSMAYPVLLGGVGFVILNVLVIFFVPKFEPIFEKLAKKGELPGLTVFIIGLSHFLQTHWWWLGGLFFGGVVLFRRWKNSDAGRIAFDRVQLKIPVAGTLVLSLALGRFTRILGTLLANGIPILRSLQIAKDSTGNKVLSHAIEESVENITAGQKLAAPLRRCKYFPSDVVEMIAVAEESNSLDKVLVDIANALEKRSSRQLKLFVKLMEPVMLLVMAAITLIVVAGLLLPVFKMGSAVG